MEKIRWNAMRSQLGNVFFSFSPALFFIAVGMRNAHQTSNTLIMVTNINTSAKILLAFRRLMPVWAKYAVCLHLIRSTYYVCVWTRRGFDFIVSPAALYVFFLNLEINRTLFFLLFFTLRCQSKYMPDVSLCALHVKHFSRKTVNKGNGIGFGFVRSAGKSIPLWRIYLFYPYITHEHMNPQWKHDDKECKFILFGSVPFYVSFLCSDSIQHRLNIDFFILFFFSLDAGLSFGWMHRAWFYSGDWQCRIVVHIKIRFEVKIKIVRNIIWWRIWSRYALPLWQLNV